MTHRNASYAAYAATGVVIAFGLAVSACDQTGSQPMAYGGMGSAVAMETGNPDIAPVNGRTPVESPAASAGGTGSLGTYDGGAAQQ